MFKKKSLSAQDQRKLPQPKPEKELDTQPNFRAPDEGSLISGGVTDSHASEARLAAAARKPTDAPLLTQRRVFSVMNSQTAKELDRHAMLKGHSTDIASKNPASSLAPPLRCHDPIHDAPMVHNLQDQCKKKKGPASAREPTTIAASGTIPASSPHEEEEGFWCSSCNLPFSSIEERQAHYDRDPQHNALQYYWCYTCNVPYKSLEDLQAHYKAHPEHPASEATKPFASFSNSSSTTAGATGTRLAPHHQCFGCKEPHQTFADLRDHYKDFPEHMITQQDTELPSLAFQPLTTQLTDVSEWSYCFTCEIMFPTYQERERHYMFDPQHIKRTYTKRGVPFDDDMVDQLVREAKNAMAPVVDRGDDVDYGRCLNTNDDARLWQSEFDDAVVELALYNYETFYKLESGTATYTTVYSTSAGIDGWAACTFDDVVVEPKKEEGKEADSETATPKKVAPRGDEEENRMLRLAMMESVLDANGVTGTASPVVDTEGDQGQSFWNNVYYGDGDSSSSSSSSDEFEYDDDYGSDEEEDEDGDSRSYSECPDNEEEDCGENGTEKEEEEGGMQDPEEEDSEAPEAEEDSESGESWSQVSEAANSEDDSELSDPVVVEADEESSRDRKSVV